MEVFKMRTNVTAPDVRRGSGQGGRGLESFLERFGSPYESPVAGKWVPPVDVLEDAERFLLIAELPGIGRDDIDVSFADGRLTIRGERELRNGAEGHRYHRIEREYGSFVRSFSLPRTVDPERISASFESGILEISVAKRAEARPRPIRIDVK
jgi:HSP20 family protein